MTKTAATTTEQVLIAVVEDVTRRLNSGDTAIDFDYYAAQYPNHAEKIRSLVPALQVIAKLGTREGDQVSRDEPPNGGSLPTGVIGDFQIVAEIGRGGMGVVYEAQQISLNRRVALKVLPFAAMLDSRQLKRFKTEAQAAATLHHQNIVPVYGIGTERGIHYYAMQYVDGQTLANVIANLRLLEGREAGQTERREASELAARIASRHLSPYHERHTQETSDFRVATNTVQPTLTTTQLIPDSSNQPKCEIPSTHSTQSTVFFRNLAQLGIQVAEALDHAHQEGIIHRDIKPSNLILEANGKIWVTDFGLARIESDPSLTMTGDIIGTLRYMSPEQALAKRIVIDHRTDIYSLGATLYELAALEPAFNGADRQELLRQIAFEEPARLRKRNRALPSDLETIILKCMAKNPAERYSTARDIAIDLRSFLEDRPITAKRPSLRVRVQKYCRRHKGFVASMFTIGMLTLIAGSVVETLQLRHERYVSQRRVQVNLAISNALDDAKGYLRQAEADPANRDRDLASALAASERANGLSEDDLATQEMTMLARQRTLEIQDKLKHWKESVHTSREQLKDISAQVSANRGVAVLRRLSAALEILPNDRDLQRLWEENTVRTSIEGNVDGATIQVRDIDDELGEWLELGESPLVDLRFPPGPVHVRVHKEGFETIVQLGVIEKSNPVRFALARCGDVPPGTVYIPDGEVHVCTSKQHLPQFCVGRLEVTNADYQKFVNAGGYHTSRFWPVSFDKDGSPCTLEQAMDAFVDTTGDRAPAAWVDGTFPEGQGEIPVTGVSWFEATAYAHFIGRSLPSIFHWRRSASGNPRYINSLSNIDANDGPRPVGARLALSQFGVCDVAGNVAEWCSTPDFDDKRYALGGCWSDPGYMLTMLVARSPWTRSPQIGFRCAVVGDDVPKDVDAPFGQEFHDYRSNSPMSDDRFEAMMDILYRRDEAGGTESSELEGTYEVNDVPIQRWNVDNGSGLERLPLHVYMPKQKPQAIIIYFPGAGTLNNETRHEVGYDEMFVVEFARSGYVVCWPTFDGTLERRGPGYDWGTVEARLRITWAHEVGRAVTFMRERYPKLPLVFAGFSMGGAYGPQAMVTNPGFDAAVLLSAGFHQTPSPRPETLEVNFLPRVSVPTLVINGRFDDIFPVHVSQEPFFEQLGRQHNIQKEMRILETGHGIPIDESIEIADAWLRRVFADIANSKVDES